MDPFEQRLRDEVIYLHSLWHQGPPRDPNHNPYPKPKHNPSRNLRPSNSTPFKKNITTTTKNKNKKKNKPQSDPPKVSGVEWPCAKPAAETAPPNSGWPALKLNSATSRPASAEEQAKLVATRVQQKGLEACSAFFARNRGSDVDDDQEEDDDDFVDINDCEESEEYEFFLKAFMEDNELRSYYEKNFESGVFCCLVCGGIGKKVNKRFKNCVALVQHSTAISKTAKRRAHKAYGQVICKVLGWDMNRLPSIVLSLGDSLNRSLPKSGESQGDQQENADGDKDDLSVLQ
ncbi:hypothetical protein L1049_000506 [Liquidambar formosana]|uniref:Uncharacterized protein n=1 Tax=Liquidambar formosana TaxID=63359 RepID=A0AAP0NBK7_LIQFO